MKRKKKFDGWILDPSSKKPKKNELSYDHPDQGGLNGYGTPISLVLARLIIRNFRDKKKELPEGFPDAFTFGKESLLSILTQTNCEGIRFYLARKEFNISDRSNRWKDGITLVAVGVKQEENNDLIDGNDPEIGPEAGKNYIIDDLDNIVEDSGSQQNGIIVETIPPFEGDGTKGSGWMNFLFQKKK